MVEPGLLEQVGDSRALLVVARATPHGLPRGVQPRRMGLDKLDRRVVTDPGHGLCEREGLRVEVDVVPAGERATPVEDDGVDAAGLSAVDKGLRQHVRRELIPRLAPPVTGWMAFEGTDDFTRLTSYHDTLRGDARRFELITLPYQDFAGMNASLGLLLSLGIPRIRKHLQALHEPVLAWAARTGARVASPAGERGSGILCVAPANVGQAFRALNSLRAAPECG